MTLPHGAPEVLGYGILLIFTLGLIIHWLRRAFRHPAPTELPSSDQTSDVILFDRVQRIFHWLTSAAFLGIVLTGLPLYDPVFFEPIADALGVPLHGNFPAWVMWHVLFSAMLGALLVIHVVWDVGKLRATHRMLPTVRDLRDGLARAANFLLISKHYPRMDKYDIFMKTFHIYLAVSFVLLALTGLVQLFYAPWWEYPFSLHNEIEPFWRPTLIHDIFGFLLIALVIGHTYFALLPVNRALLRAMINGRLVSSEVLRRYRELGEHK